LVRIAAGLLFGGTAGLLLAALYYSRSWAPLPGLTEHAQLTILLTHIMVGFLYGALTGPIYALWLRKKGAWVGLVAFGVLGVYAGPLLGSPLAGALRVEPETAGLIVAGAFPIVGALIGSLFLKIG
jgi:hypothetical protein